MDHEREVAVGSTRRDAIEERLGLSKGLRRRTLIASALAATPWHLVNASTPLPDPAELHEQMRYWGNWVYTGILRRRVYLPVSLALEWEKPGQDIEISEHVPWLSKPETGPDGSPTLGLWEIQSAKPILSRRTYPVDIHLQGTVYRRLSHQTIPIEEGADSKVLLVFWGRAERLLSRKLSPSSRLMDLRGRTGLDNQIFRASSIDEVMRVAPSADYVQP